MNQKEQDYIKPCPFCGSRTYFVSGPEHSYIGGQSISLHLSCQKCYAKMSTSFGEDSKETITEEAAKQALITNWNQRP